MTQGKAEEVESAKPQAVEKVSSPGGQGCGWGKKLSLRQSWRPARGNWGSGGARARDRQVRGSGDHRRRRPVFH